MRSVIGIVAIPYRDEEMGLNRQMVTEDYVKAIEKAGGVPIIIPIHKEEKETTMYMEMCNGVLFCGGLDLNPLTYGEQPHPMLGRNSLDYDQYQIDMMKHCFENEKPILAICRGIQLMNVACGGTLYQDVSLHGENTMCHMQKEQSRCGISHKVQFKEHTKLYDLFGKETYTNSYHHQAVKDLGKGLKVSAVAEDGIIEAVEGEGELFQIGVQWHPESMFSRTEAMRPLFESFVAAAYQ